MRAARGQRIVSRRTPDAHRSADRRRRLPGTQRGDPRRRPQGRRRSTATSSSASGTAGRGRWRTAPCRSASPRSAASCRAAAPSSARRAPTRSRSTAASTPIRENLHALGVDALIAIGGEDTLGVATKLHELGVNVVGVPKTIDNDLNATDYTFGFDTAVNIAMEAIDRLHTTAESHHRALIVEVMGRHAGWIALHAGLAGGANVILIPEVPFSVDRVCAYVESRFQSHYAPILVVAEGATPDVGEDVLVDQGTGRVRARPSRGGIGEWLAGQIEQQTGKEARTIVLGHIQRGGTPTAFDRVLATRFGLHAIDAVQDGDWGKMVALRGTDIVRVPLAEATDEAEDRPTGALLRGRGVLRLTRRARRLGPRRITLIRWSPATSSASAVPCWPLPATRPPTSCSARRV